MRTLRAGIPAVALLAAALLGAPRVDAQSTPMDDDRLGTLIQRIDPQAVGGPGLWRLRVRDREVMVITDARADRMRIVAGVAPADTLEQDMLYRLMQANFDTALDARYAVAQGVLWSAFIHPLGALDDRQFISGLGQVVNLALSFGTTFSSGALTFGGGDSSELIQELLERSESI